MIIHKKRKTYVQTSCKQLRKDMLALQSFLEQCQWQLDLLGSGELQQDAKAALQTTMYRCDVMLKRIDATEEALRTGQKDRLVMLGKCMDMEYVRLQEAWNKARAHFQLLVNLGH